MSPPFQTPYREPSEPTNADLMRKLDSLETHITGGATPERGVIVRMDRLEQAQASQRRWGLAAIGGGGAGLLGALKAWIMTSGTPPHP